MPMADPSPPHRPDIHVAPPLVFMAGFITGFIVDRNIARFRIVADPSAHQPIALTGLVLIVAGLLLTLWAVVTLHRARTTVLPFRAATAMVREGPYGFSRNPMYLGMTLGYLGLAMVFNTVWPVMLLPVVLWALVKLVIQREEAYLEAVFGDAYRSYRRDVRRWL